jgi:plastocyanin
MKKLIGSKSSLLIGIAIFFAIFSISNSCTKTNMSDGGGPGPTGGPSGKNVVSVNRGGFDPAIITVVAGDTVTWTSKDGNTQSVTSDSGFFNGIISSSEIYSYKFSIVGTYQYFSRINPNLTGKVVVN